MRTKWLVERNDFRKTGILTIVFRRNIKIILIFQTWIFTTQAIFKVLRGAGQM